MTGLLAVAPILLALVIGYGAGCVLPAPWRRRLGSLLGPLVLVLLFSIGLSFGNVLRSASHAGNALVTALWLAAWTTLFSWLLIFASMALAQRLHGRHAGSAKTKDASRWEGMLTDGVRQGGSEAATATGHARRVPGGDGRAIPDASTTGIPAVAPVHAGWWAPARECLIALSMVLAGVIANGVCARYDVPLPMHLTSRLLFLLVAIVGMELAAVAIDARWWSRQVLIVPLLVIVGSLLGGTIASALSALPYATAWALSSGFGWFTLSGVMIGQHLGAQWGAVALLTDLSRELMSVVLLYLFGRRFSRACIGASGATAMDSTLPIIKQHCAPSHWPTALVSGFVLSLAAPLLMSLFLL